MNFQHTLTIPAEREAATPWRQRIRLTAGVVSLIHPIVPSGCFGLVGVRILRGNFQLWPMTEGEWFVADDFADGFEVDFPLDTPPYELILEGYNTDEKYPHSVSFRIRIDRRGDPGVALLELIEERIPANLSQLVVSMVDTEGHSEQVITIMQDELVPILQASLQAQQKLLERSYSDMSLKELLDF